MPEHVSIQFDESQFERLLEMLAASRRNNTINQILRNSEVIVANLQQLQAAVDQAAQDAKDNAVAVTAEIARIEALIASLGTSGIDPALLDPIVKQLTDISTSLKTTTAAATGERP
jgi:hypothetical protein